MLSLPEYAGITFQFVYTNAPGTGFYDDELLDAHYMAGDGRANENIALTAVHHVFHAEHNRMVDQMKELIVSFGRNSSTWSTTGPSVATWYSRRASSRTRMMAP